MFYYCGIELLIHYDSLRASLLPALLTLQIVLGTYHYTELLNGEGRMGLSFGLYLWFAISELFVLGIMIVAAVYLQKNHLRIAKYLSDRTSDTDEGPVAWLARHPARLDFVWDKLVLVLGSLIFLGCLVIGGLKFLGIV